MRQATNFFGDALGANPLDREDESGLDALANLGYLPGRVLESPFSVLNTVTGGGPEKPGPGLQSLRGPGMVGGKTKGLIDNIADTLGEVPILGDVLSGANNLLVEGSKIGPALVNSGDINKLILLRPYSDETKLTDIPGLQSGRGSDPFSALATIMDRDKTVGDFRKEMLGRGITNEDIAAVLGEEKQPWDFGERPSSTNPLLGVAQSAAFDPTNLIFGTGVVGAAVKGFKAGLKPVTTGIGLLPKMEKLQLASRVAPDAVTSAQMIFEGNAAGATLQGVGHFIKNTLAHPSRLLRPYVKTAVATSAATVALDVTTDWLDDALPDDDLLLSPLIKDLHDLSSAIINDHPLSEGAAWNFAAAFHFPVRDFASGVAQAGRSTRRKFLGGDGAVAALGDALGVGKSRGARKADFLTSYGGERGAQTLVDFIDDQIAHESTGAPIKKNFRSIDSPAAREYHLHELTHVVRDRMRDEGKITNEMRVERFKSWFAEQSGFERSGVRQAWDAARAAYHWTNVWVPVQKQYGSVLGARAQAVIQLEPNLHVEDIANIKSVWRASLNPDGTVPLSVIRETMDIYPQLANTDDWFTQFGVPDAVAPSWDKVRQRLSDRGRDAPSWDETVHELATAERGAPPRTVIPRGPLTEDGFIRVTGHREMPEAFTRDVVGQTPVDSGQAWVTARTAQMKGEKAAFDADVAARTAAPAPVDPFIQAARDAGAEPGKLMFIDRVEAKFIANGGTPEQFMEALRGHSEELRVGNTSVKGDVPKKLQPKVFEIVPNDMYGRVHLYKPGPDVAAPPPAVVPDAPPSQARVPSVDEMEPLRAAQDAGNGASPEQISLNLAIDREVFDGLEQMTMFDWAGRQRKPDVKVEFAELDKWLKENHPGYRTGYFPALGTLMRNAEIEAPQINAQVLRMNTLAESLRYWGPFSKAWNAFHMLTDPVSEPQMRANAEQAIFNYALPRGATPADIRAIIAELRADSGKIRIGFKELEFSLFRGFETLFPKHIEDVAQAHLDPKVYGRIKTDFGGFTRMVDRSFNRFVQRQHRIGREAGAHGALARSLEGVYGAWQNTGGKPLRYLKSFYPLIRFALSPRWWGMNAYEANILSLVKYGTGAADQKAGLASLVHRHNAMPDERFIAEASKVVSIDNAAPLVLGRQFAGWVSANFDATRPDGVKQLLDNLPRDGREFQTLVKRFGPNEGTWGEQLDRMLYDFDTKGVQQTLTDEAARVLNQEDAVRMAPILQRLYEVNHDSFRSMVHVLEGNSARPNWERVMNSYFLYWPLSYQLKAGKWLLDVMTDRAFGRKTNFGGAYTYAHLLETHKERAATDPEYQKMFEDNPDIWFAAQMIFPITPFDMGVSLNRAVRYAGGELGWWGAYQAAKDPWSAAAKMLELGPFYDLQLLERVWKDAMPKPERKPPAQPAALYPVQAQPPAYRGAM